MKVLAIIDGIGPAAARGVEVIYQNLCELQNNGIDVTLLTTIDAYTDKKKWKEWASEQKKTHNITIIVVDWSRLSAVYFALWFSKLLIFLKAVQILLLYRFDVVHEFSSTPFMFLSTVLLRIIGRCKGVHSIVTGNTSSLGNPKFSFFGKFLSCIIVPVPSLKSQFSNYVNPSKVYILPYGISLQLFTQKKKIINNYHFPTKKKKVLYLGPPEKFKGVLVLAAAARKILEKNKNYYFVFIVFRKRSENLYAQGKHAIEEKLLGFEKNYSIIDRLVDVPEVFQQVDIVVLPQLSPHGTLIPPLTLIEAMAAGKLVIVPDQVELKEVVIDKVNGYLFRNNSVSSLAKALVSTNTSDNSLGQKAQKLAIERFNYKTNAKQLKAIYTEIVA